MADAAGSGGREVVIRTETLTKRYRGFFEDLMRLSGVIALQDLNMEVYRGEVFAMIGPNGSGKTTTLKLLMGLIFPTQGVVRVLGRDPRKEVQIKRRVGFMPDGPYFYGHLNGYELLDFYAGLLGMDPAVRRRRVPELLDLVGMTNRAKLRLRTYSKGMVQRIGLAHAMLNDPEIVFLDEPTSGLDPIGARDIRRVVERMKDEGKTIFLCSHFLSEIEHLCDRVILLDRGRTLRYGPLEELLAVPGKMRLRVTGINAEGYAKLGQLGRQLHPGAEREAPTWVINDGPDVTVALDLVKAHGGRLEGLLAMRHSLEEVFMEAVERTQADQPYEAREQPLERPVAPPRETPEPEPVASAGEGEL